LVDVWLTHAGGGVARLVTGLVKAKKEAQGMIKLELSAKMLRFVIDAVEERIAGYSRALEDASLSEDELADIGNDRMLLMSAVDYLKREEQTWRERP
jgi:hypothetical protein